MKNVFVSSVLLVGLLASASLASVVVVQPTQTAPVTQNIQAAPVQQSLGNNFGISITGKSVVFTGSVGSSSGDMTGANIYGLGLNMKVPLNGNKLALLVEGEYNTVSDYSIGGVKVADASVYPLQVSLISSLGGIYVGGGANYSLWTVSVVGSNATVDNGIGYQAFIGTDAIFAHNVNLELKYTHMASSVTVGSTKADFGANTISLGLKLWVI